MVKKEIECKEGYEPSLKKGNEDSSGIWKQDVIYCKKIDSKPLLRKETREAYYYNKFPIGYYIIRWLDDGGFHFYPSGENKFPKSFRSNQIRGS
jgi:hypothetical protein